jgi:hypothetical protein
MNIPKINQTTTIINKIKTLLPPMSVKTFVSASVIPPIASNLEYICAQIKINKIGAEIFPVSKTESKISLKETPFNIAKINANKAPIPAASVGVKKPNQMPPKTKTIKNETPTAPQYCLFVRLTSSA